MQKMKFQENSYSPNRQDSKSLSLQTGVSHYLHYICVSSKQRNTMQAHIHQNQHLQANHKTK